MCSCTHKASMLTAAPPHCSLHLIAFFTFFFRWYTHREGDERHTYRQASATYTANASCAVGECECTQTCCVRTSLRLLCQDLSLVLIATIHAMVTGQGSSVWEYSGVTYNFGPSVINVKVLRSPLAHPTRLPRLHRHPSPPVPFLRLRRRYVPSMDWPTLQILRTTN